MTVRLLQHVASPLVAFQPAPGTTLPERWSIGTHRVRLRLLGCIPFGEQAIVISFPDTANGFAVRDAGYSRLIRTWDHRITIRSCHDGVVYSDEVTVRAGVLTPLIWLFAQLFYRHRQRRWRALAETQFTAIC